MIFGDSLSLLRHIQRFGQAHRKKKKEIVLPAAVKKQFPSRNEIELLATKLVQEANQVGNDQEAETICCIALMDALKAIFPNCLAHPFGSRITGLSDMDSDLDIFFDVDNMYSGKFNHDPDKQSDIVKIVAKELKRYKQNFSHINMVPWARTPIVQVYHIDTNIDCDISFKHGLSVENTALIK